MAAGDVNIPNSYTYIAESKGFFLRLFKNKTKNILSSNNSNFTEHNAILQHMLSFFTITKYLTEATY